MVGCSSWAVHAHRTSGALALHQRYIRIWRSHRPCGGHTGTAFSTASHTALAYDTLESVAATARLDCA